MKTHWFVQLIFFLFVCIFSYVGTRCTCILSYFDIKCTCIVYTCHIVCSDSIYNILCCFDTRITLFIMQSPVATVHPVKQGTVTLHMYIRMLSKMFYFCVYYIFDLIINDLVIYVGSTLRWLRLINYLTWL